MMSSTIVIGKQLTEEHRRKISESMRGKANHNTPHTVAARKKISETLKGHPVSDEARKKSGDAHRGKPLSEEHRQKIADALHGRSTSEEHRRRLSESNTGKHHSEETKRKLSEIGKGKSIPEEVRRKISEALCGRTISLDQRRWLSDYLRGGKSPFYIDGRSALRQKYCHRFNNGFKRDCRAAWGNVCVICGQPQNGLGLDVHHIHYDKEAGCNGMALECVSLCHPHHSKTIRHRDWWIAYFEQLLWRSAWGWRTDLVPEEINCGRQDGLDKMREKTWIAMEAPGSGGNREDHLSTQGLPREEHRGHEAEAVEAIMERNVSDIGGKE